MAYEKNHINIYSKEEKNKIITFKAILTESDKEIDEQRNKGITLINTEDRHMLR